MSELCYDVFETAHGWVGLLASDRGVRRSALPSASPDECVARLGPEASGARPDPDMLSDARERMRLYFEGADVDFTDVPLDVGDATEFFRRAWDACRSIPRGETRTYGWLARQAGSPKASRAAGQTMARNRAPIIVPCHRVIGSDGSLRGFGRGSEMLDLKRLLLDMEGSARRLV